MGADQRHQFRFSLRSLMIVVVVCALLLLPISWVAHRNTLLEAMRMRAEADRIRAVALSASARAAYMARVSTLGMASSATETESDKGVEPEKESPGTERGPWAALTVNHPVFQGAETKELMIEFALVNDGDTVLDPRITDSRIIIDGKELADSGFILSNGPRDARFGALPPGETLRFAYALGSYFEEPGIHRVSWRGASFRAPEVVFRVLPGTANSTGAH